MTLQKMFIIDVYMKGWMLSYHQAAHHVRAVDTAEFQARTQPCCLAWSMSTAYLFLQQTYLYAIACLCKDGVVDVEYYYAASRAALTSVSAHSPAFLQGTQHKVLLSGRRPCWRRTPGARQTCRRARLRLRRSWTWLPGQRAQPSCAQTSSARLPKGAP